MVWLVSANLPVDKVILKRSLAFFVPLFVVIQMRDVHHRFLHLNTKSFVVLFEDVMDPLDDGAL